ncbi:LAETG motif-containing sortase-dependent surface protein [Streptomyces sp. ID05-39B]|uniref:LAETG motif-containing sortase-dependent surface protein n=1 Tax=Streptomyces sp. ID05-39B TaxID=3028664 RepID=UPI0029BD4562|nr:LAETG motif-containing sortase-dependent surface protein [Streptomyces sp. ID05-39B]MDX3528997.1 LAETG motif-containing sortase-dependent surface protein [Streptomyces sp. ID05-39B]
MSSARRPLLTATAAGTLLGALWFVPNAQATQDEPVRTAVTTQVTTQARAVSADSTGTALTADTTLTADTSDSTSGGTRLADTGSFDTTPYIVGGTALLALGAGFVAYSVRRERLGF